MSIETKKLWALYRKYKPQYCSLGLRYENSRSAVKYFCTPKGADIFASMGVGGIHFCTIKGHGDKIFVVCPEPCSERYVFPIANDITEFFDLIASSYGTELLDQIPRLGKQRYDEMLEEHVKNNSDLFTKDLEDFVNKFNIVDRKAPVYDIVMGLYNEFDYSTIKFTPLYYDTLGIEEE